MEIWVPKLRFWVPKVKIRGSGQGFWVSEEGPDVEKGAENSEKWPVEAKSGWRASQTSKSRKSVEKRVFSAGRCLGVVRGGVRGGVKKRGLFVGGRKWTRTLGIGGAQKSGFREMTKKRVFLGGVSGGVGKLGIFEKNVFFRRLGGYGGVSRGYTPRVQFIYYI